MDKDITYGRPQGDMRAFVEELMQLCKKHGATITPIKKAVLIELAAVHNGRTAMTFSFQIATESALYYHSRCCMSADASL